MNEYLDSSARMKERWEEYIHFADPSTLDPTDEKWIVLDGNYSIDSLEAILQEAVRLRALHKEQALQP